MRTSLRTIPLADQFASDSVITLDQIRTVPRRTNDYVDSPRALATPPIKPHLSSHSHHVEGGGGGLGTGGGVSPGFAHRLLPSRTGSVVAGGRVVVGGGGGGGIGGGGRSALLAPSTVVSHQPVSKPCPLKKNVDSLDDNGGGVHTHIASGDNGLNGEDLFAAAEASHGEEGGGGIICDKCHRCKCNDCTDTKPLPSHWCCGNVYEVSPEKVLDDCTCFCCVKCTMYHCGNEDDYENPCGCCSTPHCMRRWTFMTVVALCLPCLWAYWPARGCLSACTTVYNRCWWGKKGCNCQCNNNIVKLDSDTNKRSVLSRGSGGGSGGTSGGGGGGGTKNSQSRRLLIDRDSSSTST